MPLLPTLAFTSPNEPPWQTLLWRTGVHALHTVQILGTMVAIGTHFNTCFAYPNPFLTSLFSFFPLHIAHVFRLQRYLHEQPQGRVGGQTGKY